MSGIKQKEKYDSTIYFYKKWECMKKIIFISFIFLFGCAAPQQPEYRLGQFTAASSFNVRNLSYDVSTSTRVLGEDCYQHGLPPNDARLQRAMDSAIRNGQDKGVSGDLLINVRIDEYTKITGYFIFTTLYHCIKVEGDLVTLKTPNLN